jgi:DNA-binding NarL/FixJ family response regulator
MVQSGGVVHDQDMPMNVLIVDDSPTVRTSLRWLLRCIKGVGVVREAGTLSETLEGVRSDPPVVLILDLRLPDGLSDSVLQTLKQLAPEMRIAVFSLHADSSHQQQCQALGVDWFFDKTTQTEALLDWLMLEVQRFVPTGSDVMDPNPEKTP